ncbi:ATP11-domain-containing protein [Boletus reticuloceps]|uniref:ATP11-domain-containing protein n=1 Tax=Boletus reticuloceps TaxID=495285 RepID=A0A8I2YH41_9AGAM|nr:ATP11-domain-containing protein [Boletus reticuloceps]
MFNVATLSDCCPKQRYLACPVQSLQFGRTNLCPLFGPVSNLYTQPEPADSLTWQSHMSFQMIRPTLQARVYQSTPYARFRCIHSGSPAASYNLKYIDKLQQKAQEKGLDVEELGSQAREEARRKQKMEAASLLASFKKADHGLPRAKARPDAPEGARTFSIRKDSSPIKASVQMRRDSYASMLNSPIDSSAAFLDIEYLKTHSNTTHIITNIRTVDSVPCLAKQGHRKRLYLCFPPFGVVQCNDACCKKVSGPTPDPSSSESTGTAHEFFFLQWDFHPAPPIPAVSESNPFEPMTPSSSSRHNTEPSTVLFTPLQEYKLRTSFATPYLVLTFYTDLSRSHGIVLLRGEITPSSAAVQPGTGIPERFLLNQVDAQLLAIGLQKFYLWGDGGKDNDHDLSAEMLLKQFHEEPEKFSWKDLLRILDVVA